MMRLQPGNELYSFIRIQATASISSTLWGNFTSGPGVTRVEAPST